MATAARAPPSTPPIGQSRYCSVQKIVITKKKKKFSPFFTSKVKCFFSCFNLCNTLQACVVSDNFASKKFCNFDAFQSKSVLSRITSFNLNCQTPMITVNRHLNVFTWTSWKWFFFSSIWTVNINVSCLEASQLDLTALHLYHNLAHLSWSILVLAVLFRTWEAEKLRKLRLKGARPTIQNCNHGSKNIQMEPWIVFCCCVMRFI